MLSAFSGRLVQYDYPQADFERIWKEVLLYQFHDILPGSSIKRVYDESLARYEELYRNAAELRDRAADALVSRIDTSSCKKPNVIFNTLSFPRGQWLRVDGKYLYAEVPAIGYSVIETADLSGDKDKETANEILNFANVIENETLRVKFGDDGTIVSLINKKIDSDLLESPSNLLLLYKDTGNAWDIPYDYRDAAPERAMLDNCAYVVEGPVQCVKQTYKYNQSVFNVTVSLTQGSERLDFSMEADWHEKETMLRLQFNPAVKCSCVESEIQYGYISRSFMDNNTYEKAQHEICAHNWIGVSQPGLVFAVLNDCKYGYYAKNGMIEMNVLRGASCRGEVIDCGRFALRYSLIGYQEDPGYIKITRQALDLNTGLLMRGADRHNGDLPSENSFVNLRHEYGGSVLIDAVKKAEQSNAVIIRSYESSGQNTGVEYELGLGSGRVTECDLCEAYLSDINNIVEYKPFEIKTLCASLIS